MGPDANASSARAHLIAFRMLTRFSPRRFASLFAVLAAVGLMAAVGCSSSSAPAPSASSEPEAPQGPALSFVTVTAEGMQAHDARTGETVTLAPGATSAGPAATSPSGRYLAVAYRADSSRVALLDLQTFALTPLQARAKAVTYSLAWHAQDDRLAFAYYTPASDGARGPGGVYRAVPGGAVQSVGCSAAREVLDWADGAIAARDDDNLYRVAPEGCATQARLDVRKMYHLTYSSDGARLAYVLRDLRYARDRGEYVPDSTLYVSDAAGRDAEKLFEDARKARNLQWSPTAPELAFDLHPEQTDRRSIVTYDAAAGRTTFLVPPSAGGTADQAHPRWSPEGTYLAFLQSTERGRTAAVRTAGQTRTLGPATAPVQWVTERRVAVSGPDSVRVKTLSGRTVYALPAPDALLHVGSRAGV